MNSTRLEKVFQKCKPGNYFRELSIVIAGVFITLAGTDFISKTSQQEQIKEIMQMIQMELSENFKEISQAETAYLNEIKFFHLLAQKQDSLHLIEASLLTKNRNAPFRVFDLRYSEDALEVLKNSALMPQIADKQFILKLLQAYKQCRIIKDNNKDYYEYKQTHIQRYMNRRTSRKSRNEKNDTDIYETWKERLQSDEIKQLILTMPNTFDENPFPLAKEAIQEVILLIKHKY